MNRATLLATLLIAFSSSPALARDDDLTFSSSVTPVFGGGELEGCSAVFDAAHRDFEYHGGELVHLAGSVTFNIFPGQLPVVMFKLGVRPASGSQFHAPAEVYLVRGTETNKIDKLKDIPGERPGFKVFGFRGDEQTLNSLMDIGDSGHLTFGYSMRPGGTLSLVEVNVKLKRFDLEDPRRSDLDDAAPARWSSCMQESIDVAIARLDGK